MVGALACSATGFSAVRGIEAGRQHQAAADIAALSGARAMWEGGGIREVEQAARASAGANGVSQARLIASGTSPSDGRVQVEVREPIRVGFGPFSVSIPTKDTSRAEVVDWLGGGLSPAPGDYRGPFRWRQGKPMRPDVAAAFDVMATEA
ncbi:MAG: hypothetical protein WCI34_07345, partial [Actinomycetes bacterium]